MKGVYRNWCQGTSSALMLKANMWKSRQRHVPKLVYYVSVLLLKNILVVYGETFLTLWTALIPTMNTWSGWSVSTRFVQRIGSSIPATGMDACVRVCASKMKLENKQ